MISCKDAAKRLYEYLDKELPGIEYDEIKAHLDLCRACCQRFKFEEILCSIIRDKGKNKRMSLSLKIKILKEIESQK